MINIQDLITSLELQPHIEGGYFKETYRSEAQYITKDGQSRSLATLIYFLLPYGNYSKFHKIESDEIWIYQAGSPLLIHMINQEGKLHTVTLGLDVAKGQQPQVCIPAQTIFGAEVLDAHSFSLTSCMVAPGFDFTDFQLYDKAELMERFADLAPIILHLHQ
jgi:predicted cupin superfamily sugar epimerase